MENSRVLRGFLSIFVVLVSLSLVSSLDLSTTIEPVKTSIINDGPEPAVFNFKVTNNGPTKTFEIYTFERVRIEPTNFEVDFKGSKEIELLFFPIDSMQDNVGHTKIPFFIRELGGSESQEHEVVIELIDFGQIFDLKTSDVNPDSDSLDVSFYNIENFAYEDVEVVFSSNFFKDTKATMNLNPFEKKDFTIPLDKEKFKSLVASEYIITASYTVDGRVSIMERGVRLIEKSGLAVQESNDGNIIRVNSITKTNEGNVLTTAEINVRKNIISRLFTTFSIEPDIVERNGMFVDYVWQKELYPSESLSVNTTTNLLFPVILIGLLGIIIYLFRVYVTSNLLVKKRVSFVRTKGGEFALRVTLNVKARKFLQRVRIYDRLPAMSKLYEKFGTKPDRFNQSTGIMEWHLDHLGAGEERIFTYVIYSKLKVVGKFELPSCNGVYELDGKIHETKSNRSFFINEPQTKTRVEED